MFELNEHIVFLILSIKYTSNFNDNQMQFSCLLSKMINIKSLQSRETFVLSYSYYCHSCYYYSCCCMHNVICLHYKCILRGENVYINKKTFFFLGKCNVIILYTIGMKGHCDTKCMCDKIHVC